MNEIKFNDEIFAKIIDLNHLENGLNFFSNDDEFIQVGTWKYEKGKTLDKHYHNFFERISYRTSEAVLVLNGEIECSIFTEENQFIWKGKLKKNQLIIQLQGAHEYSIIEDSQVLEIKNGPYFGPEKDRTRI